MASSLTTGHLLGTAAPTPPAPPFNMPIQTCSGPIGGGGQRTAASWPSYAPVHTFFADAFPALARTLTGESPDRFGIYHYELGVCDFDGPSDAARAVAALTAACGSLAATTLALATRVGAPEDASAELLAARARLELRRIPTDSRYLQLECFGTNFLGLSLSSRRGTTGSRRPTGPRKPWETSSI